MNTLTGFGQRYPETTEDSGRFSGSIDAVITWVDGDDPVHRQKFETYLQISRPDRFHNRALSRTRFTCSNEIWFCLYSIRKFAPWINRIYMVTDSQKPRWLTRERQQELGVTIVDHEVIFNGFEAYLPSFNSLSIETLICRIPGLSNNFIYFNDDVFLINPVSESDFFRDGKPVLRGSWMNAGKSPLRRLFSGKKSKQEGLVGARNEEKWVPVNDRVFRMAHTPHPLQRHVMEIFLENHDAIVQNLRHRFRSREQFWIISLTANHLLRLNEAVHGSEDWLYLNFEKASCLERLAFLCRSIDDGRFRSLCVQSLDQAHPDQHAEVVDLLERKIRKVYDRA